MFHDDFLLRDRFGPHQRLVLPRRSFGDLAHARPEGSLRQHANLVYFAFPNITILAQADHLVVISVFPMAPNESRTVVTMRLASEPQDEKARAYWEKNRRVTLEVLGEDFAMAERVQQGLASGALTHTRIGRNEVGLLDFHAALAALMG